MKIKVTVVIPFYDDFMLLKRAINSVKNQSFKNYELIIIYDNPENKENVKLRGWLGGKKRMRFRVTYLEPNDDIYIIGSARSPNLDETNGLKKITAVIDKSKDGIFILSDKSEKELIDDYGGQSWIVPLGIILSSIGLSLILKSAGVF